MGLKGLSSILKIARFRFFVFLVFFQKLRQRHFDGLPLNQSLSDSYRVFTDPHEFWISFRCTIHFSQNHSAISRSRAWGIYPPSDFSTFWAQFWFFSNYRTSTFLSILAQNLCTIHFFEISSGSKVVFFISWSKKLSKTRFFRPLSINSDPIQVVPSPIDLSYEYASNAPLTSFWDTFLVVKIIISYIYNFGLYSTI